MKEALDSIKPNVRAVKAYTLAPHRASLKLNQNENPWDAPARIKDEVMRRFAERKWSQYPDFVPARLNEQLAAFAGWRADGVIAGNGSNELIQAVLIVTMEPGKTVLSFELTCRIGDEYWNMTDEQLFQLALEDCKRVHK